MSISFGSNLFQPIPLPNIDTHYIWVSDFFMSEIGGGAELTSQAIIDAAPSPVAQVKSNNLSTALVNKFQDKHWIVSNFGNAPREAMIRLSEANVLYTLIEYDFKYCRYRSPTWHWLSEHKQCDCPTSEHGNIVRKIFNNSKQIAWMAKGQQIKYLQAFPELQNHNQFIQSSTFDNKTLDALADLRQHGLKDKKDRWCILGSGTWIKGVKETEKWCQDNKVNYEAIPNMPYNRFLSELVRYKGLIFYPLARDTAPRLAIEAKLLGLELKLNENVLNSSEQYMLGSIEVCEAYLRTNAKEFWNKIAI